MILGLQRADGTENMESRRIRYFMAVAEEGSFTAAAARLRVAQPALSRQVAALEQEVGTPVFARGPGGVTLTEAGEVLRRHGEAVVMHAARAREEISALCGEATGWISFGTAPSLGRLLFGAVAARMTTRFPGLRMSFVEGVGAQLLTNISAGMLDVAITSRPAYAPGIAFRWLFDEQVYLVGASVSEMPGAASGWEDLHGLPLVVTNQQTSVASWVEELSGDARTALDLRFRVESAHAAIDIASCGLAYAVLPQSALDEANAGDALSAVPLRAVTLDRHLAWSRDRETTAAFGAFCDVVSDEARACFLGERKGRSKR